MLPSENTFTFKNNFVSVFSFNIILKLLSGEPCSALLLFPLHTYKCILSGSREIKENCSEIVALFENKLSEGPFMANVH